MSVKPRPTRLSLEKLSQGAHFRHREVGSQPSAARPPVRGSVEDARDLLAFGHVAQRSSLLDAPDDE
jgi:hypothetical protein